jgi:hypothetical protein
MHRKLGVVRNGLPAHLPAGVPADLVDCELEAFQLGPGRSDFDRVELDVVVAVVQVKRSPTLARTLTYPR